MQKKIAVFSILVFVAINMSGCLVFDNSTNMLPDDEVEEIKIKAANITEDFFEYNEYDPSNDKTFNVQGLIDLFVQDANNVVLKIDPILGSSYEKTFEELKSELLEQNNIFERQENYKLVFEDNQGNKSYKANFEEGIYSNYTYTYSVLFQVFEEIEGRRIITDNGIITFELDYKNKKWLINHMKIDYRGLGDISL